MVLLIHSFVNFNGQRDEIYYNTIIIFVKLTVIRFWVIFKENGVKFE